MVMTQFLHAHAFIAGIVLGAIIDIVFLCTIWLSDRLLGPRDW
jgi:hypothetical protein